MNRRFTLPLVATCSAHALLLFGFSTPVKPPHPSSVDPTTPPFTITLPPPEIEKPDDLESTDKPAGGKTAPPRPAAEDKPVERISPGEMIQEITDTRRVKVETKIISPGPVSENGDPNAKDFGPGDSRGIVFSPLNLDNTPRTRVQTPPTYPHALKASGVSGEVWVEFVVDESGRVLNPTVVRSTHSEFDAPTIAAVSRWRFEPGTRNMKPVRFRMVVPVRFNLNE